MQSVRIAHIPGDGIGPELLVQVQKVAECVAKKFSLPIQITEFPYGADYYLKSNVILPSDFAAEIEKNYQAVIMGTFGDPRIPEAHHVRGILSKLRSTLRLTIGFQHFQVYGQWLCPREDVNSRQIDFLLLRNVREGANAALSGIYPKAEGEEIAAYTTLYSYQGIKDFFQAVFEIAQRYRRENIIFIENNHFNPRIVKLWRRAFQETADQFEHINSSVKSVETCLLLLLEDPAKADMLVTNDLWGDAVSALGIYYQGGYGLANMGELSRKGLPVFRAYQNSFPKHAGHNTANPLGAVLALKEILYLLEYPAASAALDQAIQKTIQEHWVTIDLNGIIGTSEVGDYICNFVEEQGTLFESG